MKIKFKRLSLAFIALSLTAPVLADTSSPFDAFVPNQQGGLTAGIDALYMRPTASNSGAGIGYDGTPLTGLDPANLISINNGYQWGFDAIIGYRIPGTGNDATVDWTHLGTFSTSNSNRFNFVFTTAKLPGEFVISGNDSYDYNAVDLDLGQRVNFGDYFTFRMFAGGRWADVDQQIINSNVFTDLTSRPFATPLTTSTYEDSEFKGFGPQIGFDGRCAVAYGFGIDANVTGSLVIGDTDTTALFTTGAFSGSVLEHMASTTLDNNDHNLVVPALDGNIGVDYTYTFANCDHSNLSIGLGYRTINYFGLSPSLIEHTTVGSTDSDSFSNTFTLGHDVSNVSFDGPYAGVKVNF